MDASRPEEELGEALLLEVRVAILDPEAGELCDQRKRVGRAAVVLNEDRGDALEDGLGRGRDERGDLGPIDEGGDDRRRVCWRGADLRRNREELRPGLPFGEDGRARRNRTRGRRGTTST